MPATTRIILCAAPRTGSSQLRTLLDVPEAALFAGDIFHPRRARLLPRLAAQLPPGSVDRALRDADPIGYLERLVAAAPAPIFGFKWNLGHADAVLAHCIAAPDWRVAILHRDNILAMHASALAAAAAQHWNRRPGGDPAPVPPVRFEGEAFARRRRLYLDWLDGLLRRCAAAAKVFSLIEYTELQRPELVANLARQLGYPEPIALRDTVEKSGTRDVLARFSNPEAAAAAIAAIGRPDWAREWGPRFAFPAAEPPD